MQECIEKMRDRKLFLKKLIAAKQKALKYAPEGILNVVSSGTRAQYYFKNTTAEKSKKYMNKSQMPLVRKLCQKEYDQKVLSLAEKELKQIEKLLNTYDSRICEDVYGSLPAGRKKLVLPISLPDKEYIEQWEQEIYEGKGFYDGYPEYYTFKGERVRSKTEILIANTLAKYNVPYKYEKSLYLQEYGLVYPDFTVLNVQRRKVYYWEHLGMMDNPAYAEKTLQKIETYQKNDIYPGESLILTYETENHPINLKTIDRMIRHYLID